MPNPLPKRSFIGKAIDKVSNATAAIISYKDNKRAKLSEDRMKSIIGARGIPASVLGQMDQKDPAFRTKMNALNAKMEMMMEAKKGKKQTLRAKFLK